MNEAVKFSDIMKKSILKLDSFGKISSVEIFIGLLITLVIALFIFYIYRATFRGVVYSANFNLSLVLMSLITTCVIITISSNIVLSLGMVGALSIVRFRTALKDPLDIVFVFWAIGVGISTGAGVYPVAIIGSLFIGTILLIFNKFKLKSNTYIFIINYHLIANDDVKMKLNAIKHKLKSKTVTKESVELSVEVTLRNNNTAFVNEIAKIDGVLNAVLMGYNGEFSP